MIRIAFDIGGTFTDFVLHDPASADMRFSKVPSTPGNPAEAVLAGIDALFQQLDIKPEHVEGTLHATTVATNAILERKGNRTALVTTKGFRDVLLIARQKRYDTNDLYLVKPTPLVERADIFEVGERMAPDGEVLAAIDGADVETAIQRLAEGHYESVAIVFLHAYANDAHEKAVRDSIGRALPDLELCISSEVSPKFREYERTSTTVANAYVKPLVGRYLGELEGALKARGFPSDLFIMQSNGGLVPPELARDNPIRIVESGPAAGVLMCAVVGRDAGFDHVMTFDMGGTTAKLGAIDDGEPAIVSTFEVDAVQYKKGSGLPLNISAVELLEIGAGGGSIARTDMGLISVGPESAGADPGPMCYGAGGERPTITDANLVLGYLNPEYFNGGAMALDPVAAAKGIEAHIARPLGLTVQEAAWGIHSVANSNMERAMRVVSIERGRDPRNYALVAFGGAGPVHGPRLARAVEIPKLIVPFGAGVGSAIGLLEADSKIDVTMTRVLRLGGGHGAEIAGIFENLETRARRDVARLGSAVEPLWERGATMRYAGQGFEIRVELPGGGIDQTYEQKATDAFHEAYERSYGYKDPDGVIEGIDWYLIATLANGAQAPGLGVAARQAAGGAGGPVVGERQAYFPEAGGMVPCQIVDRYRMTTADRIEGPAVIEERESTTVVLPGDVASLSAAGHLVIEINMGGAGMNGDGNGAVDPITLTVFWNSLISIADEMGGTLQRTAFSEAVREGEDFSAGIFDKHARLIAQGNFTPGHLGAMPYVVRSVLEFIPPETLSPGDTLVTNDSFIGGGHYPDFYMTTPVFRGDHLIGYVVNTAHHVDVGGAWPGSQAVQGVTEAYQEGIRILPVKIVKAGEFDEDLLRVILGNVRLPENVMGDLRAQRNANHVGSQRLGSLFEAYGEETADAIVEEILDRSEKRIRESLAEIPDGTYSFDDCMDDYGPGTEPVDVRVDVTIEGDHAVVDFSRSSDQVRAGINSYINYTRAYAMFAVKVFSGGNIPHNDGVERPIQVTARAGSFFNPVYPAAGGGRSTVQVRIFDAINGAFSQVSPKKAMGAFSHWANPNFSGINDATGRPWVMYDMVFGGFGGRADTDGPEALCPVFNCANIPIEVLETKNPVRIRRLELIPDSGGAGKFRGGCGMRKDVEILSDNSQVTLLGDRHVTPPYGLFGGSPGRRAETILNPDTDAIALGSKEIRALKRGDVVSFRVAGAGGYGEARQRDPAKTLKDVRDGYVSAAAARETYNLDQDAE